MTTMLLPEIARASLRRLDEATEQDSPRTTAMLRVLADTHLAILRLIADLWGRQYVSLQNGVSGRDFLRTVNAFLECLHTSERLIGRLQEQAASKGDEALDVQDTVAEARMVTSRHVKELSALRDWLDVPPPPGLLAAAEKVASDPRTTYVSGDEVLARLLAGEDL